MEAIAIRLEAIATSDNKQLVTVFAEDTVIHRLKSLPFSHGVRSWHQMGPRSETTCGLLPWSFTLGVQWTILVTLQGTRCSGLESYRTPGIGSHGSHGWVPPIGSKKAQSSRSWPKGEQLLKTWSAEAGRPGAEPTNPPKNLELAGSR